MVFVVTSFGIIIVMQEFPAYLSEMDVYFGVLFSGRLFLHFDNVFLCIAYRLRFCPLFLMLAYVPCPVLWRFFAACFPWFNSFLRHMLSSHCNLIDSSTSTGQWAFSVIFMIYKLCIILVNGLNS